MTPIETITPQYIVEVSDTLTKDELIELITDYGNQQADEASYWATKESGY